MPTDQGADTPAEAESLLEWARARRDSRGERSPWLPLETRPDSPGEPGMQPRTEEPGRLQSMGLQRVGQDRATNTHTHTPHLVGRQRFGTQGSLGVPMLAVALGQGLDP